MYAPAEPYVHAAPASSGNRGLITDLVIGIIVLLIAVVGLVALNMGVFNRDGTSATSTVPENVTDTAEETTADGTTPRGIEPTASSTRPAATSEPERPRGSDYTSYSATTSATSEPFAQAVYNAF
ncbi:hypothetical protein [Corynebacterium cystitidis]|uniref:Uncharacterized protein n=1 Tax=Corynebacterium cystitidis DSM 20524 TaxID=1121357 RepID=A0A1H9TWE3_9CORY|nr:hypothetical protein [Corynebacterium cystitidis]WJY81919.1 hypothetical protein CCYS_04870 [Corynebacterium cystitidis DSM 20524]SES01446.1 hypothetical protein SAMN05661109_01588 [Corynebacterium cystitidis DSM 20524]SNV82054.1 Uncharacterised protein [Corynebacterium cystitidis]